MEATREQGPTRSLRVEFQAASDDALMVQRLAITGVLLIAICWLACRWALAATPGGELPVVSERPLGTNGQAP